MTMSSLIVRGSKLYAKIKGVDGTWQRHVTPFVVGEESKAERWVLDFERDIERTIAKRGTADKPLTVTLYADRWIDERQKLGHDWKKDRGILDNHILPAIGKLLVADVRTSHLIDMMTKIRTTPMADGEPRSQRTIYNIYTIAAALFRDAKNAGIIDQSPACLTAKQLGPKVDRDPEWRAQAVFARDEAETIISTPKIPHDRRVAYALELLAGLRPGEAAAVRWRHYTADKQPLGELLVAKSHSTKRNVTKGTKTEAVRHVPVHPVLAAILAEWRDGGWESINGRPPNEDDLIVPMPPADAAARTQRKDSEPFRTYYYSGRRWRDDDLPALGWRARRHYDMRATFITLLLDDGADEHIIETRVTHTKPGRGAFAGYNRGRQWERVCAEVAKLCVVWSSVVQPAESPTVTATSKLRRRVSKGNPVPVDDARRQSFRVLDCGLALPDEAGSERLDQTLVQCDFGLAMMRACFAARGRGGQSDLAALTRR